MTDIMMVISGQNSTDIMEVTWKMSHQERKKKTDITKVTWKRSPLEEGKMTDIMKVTSGQNTNDIRKGTWKRSDQRENTTGVMKVTYTNVTSGAGEGGKGD